MILGLLVLSTDGFGQLQSREEIYNNSIQKNLVIARELINKNREDSALVYLDALLAKKYNHQEALFLRAKIFSNQKRLREALTDYNALLSLNPENKEALYARGVIRYSSSQYEAALEDFQHAMKLPESETQTAFYKIDAGSKLTEGIYTISGMKTDIWNNIGLCYLAMNQFEQAIQSFNEGMSEDNRDLDLYVNRAIAYEKLGETNPAIQDYQYVLSKDPSHAIATHNLMNLQKTQFTDFEQLKSLDEFIDENPSFAQGYSSRGLFYYDRKDYNSARLDFEKALEMQPDNIDYLFNLALCQVNLKNISNAEELFLKVITVDPVHSGAYFNLGNVQFKQMHFEEAISYYTIAHNLNPKNISILYNRALAYHKNGQNEKACQDMGEVNKVDPELANTFYTKYCNSAQ